MVSSTVVVKNPSNKLARWMVAVNPDSKSNSILILKGTFPSYLFEVIPPTTEPDCYVIEHAGNMHYIRVKLDVDKMGPPPLSYMHEMLQWYSKSRTRPTLQRINSLHSNH